MTIRVNSELAHPMLFRYAHLGVDISISDDHVGFVIERPGEEDVTGETRRDFMVALRDLRHELG